MIDFLEVNKWIYEKCHGDSVIATAVGNHPILGVPQIYQSTAPQDAGFPCIVFRQMSGHFHNGTGGLKHFSSFDYFIKAVCKGETLEPIVTILARLEALFQMDQTEASGYVQGCQIVNTLSYCEILTGGIKVNHAGYQVKFFVT